MYTGTAVVTAPYVGTQRLVADRWRLDDRSYPHSQPSIGVAGARSAEKLVGPVPNGTVCAAAYESCQISSRMVRVITVQSSLMWIGITGWVRGTMRDAKQILSGYHGVH
jgi:hypothetical protein